MVTTMFEMKRLSALLLLVVSCGVLFAEVPSKHVKNLSAEDFQTRQHAYDELGLWAEKNLKIAPKTFHRLWKKHEHPEAKARFYSLMKESLIVKLKQRKTGFIGVGIGDAQIQLGQIRAKAVRISGVNEGMAGEKAGLMAGGYSYSFR